MKKILLLSLGSALLAACQQQPLRPVEVVVQVCSRHPEAQGYPQLVADLFAHTQGVQVTMSRISANSLTEVTRTVVIPRKSFMDNPLVFDENVSKARKDILDVLQTWQSKCQGAKSGAEITPAISAATSRLPHTKLRPLVIVVSSGFEQTNTVNMYDTQAQDPRVWLDSLQKSAGSEDLQQAELCFTGVNAGDNRADSRLTQRVKDFWQAYVESHHGTLVGYGANDTCGLTGNKG